MVTGELGRSRSIDCCNKSLSGCIPSEPDLPSRVVNRSVRVSWKRTWPPRRSVFSRQKSPAQPRI
jgi:hypothetical protein